MAKLQLKFAVAARDENRYHVLDEREVASSLQDWLKDRHSLPEETAAEVAGKLADKWRTGKIQVDQAPPIVLESVPDMEVEGPDADSDSQEHPDPPAAKVPRAEDRRSKYVVVELHWGDIQIAQIGGKWVLDGEEAGVPEQSGVPKSPQ